jgi:hypothetical protein
VEVVMVAVAGTGKNGGPAARGGMGGHMVVLLVAIHRIQIGEHCVSHNRTRTAVDILEV